MYAVLRKQGGCPRLRYKGTTIQFEAVDGEGDEDAPTTFEATVDDARFGREVANVHRAIEVELVEEDDDDADADTDDGDGNAVPSLAEAEEDYRAAQQLAVHRGVDASGTHEEILARLEDDEEGDDE